MNEPNPPTPFALREEYMELLRRDLLGPADGPEEELPPREKRVRTRYLLGMLAPGGIADPGTDAGRDEEAEAESAEVAGERLGTAGADSPADGATDEQAALVDSLMPSSAGFSFMVAEEETAFAVRVGWGRYTRGPSADAEVTESVWKRDQARPPVFTVPLRPGRGNCLPEAGVEVQVKWNIHRRGPFRHVSLFLVNAQPKKRRHVDDHWLFQVEMAVESADGAGRPIFARLPQRSAGSDLLDALEREERESLELRYRHAGVFAAGHGCAVRVEGREGDRASRLVMDFLPAHHAPGQTPRDGKDDPLLQGVTLDMAELAKMPREDLIADLERIAAAYEAWARGLRASAPEEHGRAALREEKAALRALERIREGVALLARDDAALAAFRFANSAMRHQRVHSMLTQTIRKNRTPDMTPADKAALLRELDAPKNHSWRLFQLTFVLLNLPSLTDPLHRDRSGEGCDATADLLWFATGGGKTEAYLGLTAYTLALRRLRRDENLGGLDAMRGVGVLMRYTLRLLTLQQFQRAAALVCACEELRRKDVALWGEEPFRLGLWVGSKSTPNTLEAAQRRRDDRRNVFSAEGSPLQLKTCPWCGAPIGVNNIAVSQGVRGSGRCLTYCGDASGSCLFTAKRSPDEGLPVMVVDEEIYRRPPALLIATVDKFAQMPWKGEVGMLFGRVTKLCPRHGFLSPDVDDADHRAGPGGRPPASKREDHPRLRPPDLIIQDELHLISGPLGSMTALYETAVDALCEWELDGRVVRPRVVASTATIRRAGEQIRRVFNRRVEVFPPPGADSRDNFFSLERPIGEDAPGRVYMGICPIGLRIPAANVRLYATALSAAQKLYEKWGVAADPWMTAVGYFNSIRELAGARRLLDDEVRNRLRSGELRGLVKRTLRQVKELTSRQSSAKIPDILEGLENGFAPDAPAETDAPDAPTKNRAYPYDVVLATNMISVGVDIDRLGLMLVNGQPKTTSEYIQATSRVGRSARAPGLVLTLYHWARPRDLSHFEGFYSYHEAYQRHVEALSVTPFAPRALDRGLAGVLVSLVRQMTTLMNGNTDAQKLPLPECDALCKRARELIVRRVEAVSQDKRVSDFVDAYLWCLRDEWLERARALEATKLAYKPTSNAVGLLAQPEEREPFSCLNSLRDVERTVQLALDTDNRGLRA